MNDAQRYRMNAVECLSAAERCEPSYRGLTLATATSWLSLARQQEAMDELLAIWSNAQSATPIRPAAFLAHGTPGQMGNCLKGGQQTGNFSCLLEHTIVQTSLAPQRRRSAALGRRRGPPCNLGVALSDNLREGASVVYYPL